MSTSFAVRWRLSIATGRFELGRLWPRLQADFAAASASEDDVADLHQDARKTATATFSIRTRPAPFVAAERIGGTGETVVLSTAHPAKFPDAIEAITGTRPALPDRLAHLMSDPERFETLSNSLSAVQDFVLKQCRVTSRTTIMTTEITTLANGIRVATQRMPNLETVSLGVWVAAGSPARARRPARAVAFPRAHGVQRDEIAIGPHDCRGDRKRRRRSQCLDRT